MCELLGMSANVPTDICFSFTGLMQRGGETGPHRDGWGISFYEDHGCRSFHDPSPSSSSAIAELIHRHPIKSKIVLSHIRLATHGKVCLENTHPFIRELWGRSWSFAHNGKLKGVKKRPLGRFKPIGSTDSEHALCWMLSQISERWPNKPPRNPATLAKMIENLSHQLASHGTFNILLSDSRRLFVYCTTNLFHLTRRAPFDEATLIDSNLTINFKSETTPTDVVTIIATAPLTEHEMWTPFTHKSLYIFQDGELHTRP